MWTSRNTERDAIARDSFTFAGVQYARGDAFPHRKLGVNALGLYGLWRAQRIQFVDPSDAVFDEPTVAPAPTHRRRQKRRRAARAARAAQE